VIDKPYPEQDVVCRYDVFRIGPLEFSPFPFGELGASFECVIGDGSHGENPTEDQEDPINSATGSLLHQSSDLELPGIGLPFEFTRSYNSLDPGSGPLGRGWTHSYAASLQVAGNGDAQLRGEDGQRLTYVKQQDGSFLAPNCARSTLSEFLGTYTLLRPDQVRYGFDASGRLTSVRDRNDRELTFAYTEGKLTTIADTVGRAITLAYNGSGLLTSVSVPDGRSVSYGSRTGA
jgi:YD repeat-containing protein